MDVPEQANLSWATRLNIFNIVWATRRSFSDHVGVTVEITNGRVSGKSSSICKPNNPLLNFPRTEEEAKREIKHYFKPNGNEKATYPKLGPAGKAAPGENSVTRLLWGGDRAQVCGLSAHPQEREQTKPNGDRRETVKVTLEITEIGKTIQKINENKKLVL